MDERTAGNYSIIFKNIMSYMPSRVLIILNSLIIIPIFAHILSAKQMSIYLIAIQILNIMLTCTFDWITKAVLRFHEKYRFKGMLDTLFSSIFRISTIVYVLIFLSYFLLKDIIAERFAIDNLTFLLTIFLVIPCSIRQFLYQILRIRNQAKLYTLSILLYQFAFIALFLCIFQLLPNASAVLIAMNIAIFVVDVYIINSIKPNSKFGLFIDKSIAIVVLKYSLPLIFTNSCYWFVLHIAKFMFQNGQQYLNTAIVGTAWLFASSIVPFMTVFMFASFPVIVRRFELQKRFKQYFTNLIQLYCFIFIPMVSIFCFYSKEIITAVLPENYAPAAYILPFFALSCFLHELMKLINIKYHLKIKTYIEMLIAGFAAVLAYFLNLGLTEKYSIIGAGLALFITELVLIIINIFTGAKKFDYINYKSILKTSTCVLLICTGIFFLLNGLNGNGFVKITLYCCLLAPLCLIFRKRILS